MTMLDTDHPGRVYRSPMRFRVVAGVLLAVVVLAGCGDDDANQADPGAVLADHDEASAGSAITTTTIPEDVDGAAIEVVVSALDAKNSFDLDRWLAAFEGGKRQGTPLFAEEILMNAKQHWEVVEPCQVTGENAAGEAVVECMLSNTDDFWDVGGIFDTKTQTFTVNADGLITSTKNIFASNRRDNFNRAFHQWLSDTHPDVYAEMDIGRISSNGPGFDTRDSDHMLVAVDYVEEFVAQSDTYPLDPTDP
jgi:hypothetical protein